MNELTKSEKRKCRELIQLGLNRECAKFVEQIRNLSQTTSEDPHAQYIAIYRKTRTFDKHVITDDKFVEAYSAMRRRPDGKSLGYIHDVVWQLAAGLPQNMI